MTFNLTHKWSIGLITVLSLFILLPMQGLATNSGFYVQPVIPENQLEQTTDYFNIGVPAKINQTLEFVITNESSEEKEFNLLILDGMTTKDGTISYDNSHTYDGSQRYKISKIATLEKNSVVISPKSSATIKVIMKEEINGFFGTILGAINISEKEKSNAQAGVNNSFAYNIPIKVRVAEDNLEKKLNYQGLTLNSNQGKQALQVTFQNPQSNIIRGLALSFDIYQKGKESTSLWSSKMEAVEVAPNSLFSPELLLGDSQLKAGDYVLKIIAKSDSISHSWQSDFTISALDEDLVNQGVEILAENQPWWLLMIIATLALGGAGYVLFYKKKRS